MTTQLKMLSMDMIAEQQQAVKYRLEFIKLSLHSFSTLHYTFCKEEAHTLRVKLIKLNNF